MHHLMHNTSGSGYHDLRGLVINYGYDAFDSFHLHIYNNKLKWQGQLGYFAGIARELTPQISRIADGIYFLSWSTGSGGDNVVMNFHESRVNAHLFDESAQGMVWNIHGKIFHYNCDEAQMPHCALTADEDVYPLIERNIIEKALPDFQWTNQPSTFPEDVAAREFLSGHQITLSTPEGELLLSFSVDRMQLSVEGGETRDYVTVATRITEDIYFISWEDVSLHQHLVVDLKAQLAYRHLAPDGSREENVFVLRFV